jgi:hypothetical protein
LTNLVNSNAPSGVQAAIGGSGTLVTVPNAMGSMGTGQNSGMLQAPFGPPVGTSGLGAQTACNASAFANQANAATPAANGGTSTLVAATLPGVVANN